MSGKLLSGFRFLNISSVCFLVLSTDSMLADWRKRCKPGSGKEISSPLQMMTSKDTEVVKIHHCSPFLFHHMFILFRSEFHVKSHFQYLATVCHVLWGIKR
jgi:hypothetical protein